MNLCAVVNISLTKIISIVKNWYCFYQEISMTLLKGMWVIYSSANGYVLKIISWAFEIYPIYSCLSIPVYQLPHQSFKFIYYISWEFYCNQIDCISLFKLALVVITKIALICKYWCEIKYFVLWCILYHKIYTLLGFFFEDLPQEIESVSNFDAN